MTEQEYQEWLWRFEMGLADESELAPDPDAEMWAK
jgi:hypothetical protein